MFKADSLSCANLCELLGGSHANQAATPPTTPVTWAVSPVPLAATSPIASVLCVCVCVSFLIFTPCSFFLLELT